MIKAEVGLTAEELVRNVFVGGTCDNISQIKGLGSPEGLGYFENGSAAIGLERGIILATGPVVFAANSNSTGDRSGDFGDKSSDPDLSKLATGSVRDRVGLEFDFVPLDSFVTFSYVFASEEYCEFVGSKYNDVFGFFVSGPGVEGGFKGNARNVALIPGSSDFVSINNVNHKKNSQYYIDNTRNHDAERCGIAYTASERENYIEYDGFTVRLTAMLKLNPCETYHIRLVVADVADNFYDSAVFLEAESFDLGGQVSVQAVLPEEKVVSEGCSNAYFEFTRENQSIDFPLNIRFALEESTTATPGVDFAPFPDFVTIPAGQRSVKLPLEVFNDEWIEQEEKIAVELDIPCACYTDSASIFIAEPPELLLKMDDLMICPEQVEYLVPEVSGGNPGYSYLWNDGSTKDRLLIEQIPEEPYSLTVTDECGHQISGLARVRPTVPPKARIEGMERICMGDTASLKVVFTGIAPWRFSYSRDGEVMPGVENIYSNPYYLRATKSGDYELVAFGDAGCGGEVQGLASVEVMEIPLKVETSSVSCTSEADGRISIELSEDFPPYTYSWDELPDLTPTLEGLTVGTYTFRVIDGRGCSRSLAIEVEEPLPLQFPAVDCETIRAGTWLPLAEGGTAPYSYYLDNNRLDASDLLREMEAGVAYNLRVEDAVGCSVQDTFLAPLLGGISVELPPQIHLLLGTTYQLNPVLHFPETLLAGVRWLPGENLSCDDCLNPTIVNFEEGIYTLHLIDQFGCTAEASTEIILNTDYPIYMPNVFSPNGDEKNDRFGVLSHAAVVNKVLRMTIYNRWGNQVFQIKNLAPGDLNAQWDGTVNGRSSPPGVYVYQVEIELTNGERKTLMGDVLLLR